MIRTFAAFAHDTLCHLRWCADMRRANKQAVQACGRAVEVFLQAKETAELAHRLTQTGLLFSADYQWARASELFDDAADLYEEGCASEEATRMEEEARLCRRMVGTLPGRALAGIPVYAIGDRA